MILTAAGAAANPKISTGIEKQIIWKILIDII